MTEEKKPLKSAERTGYQPQIEVVLGSSTDLDAFKKVTEDRKDTWEIRSTAGEEGGSFCYTMSQWGAGRPVGMCPRRLSGLARGVLKGGGDGDGTAVDPGRR